MLENNLGPVGQAFEELRTIIEAAVKKAVENGSLPQTQSGVPNFVVEIPADTSYGDFATNAAMVSAKAFRKAPAQIAKALIENLSLEGTSFEKAQVAGPGFINFFAREEWFAAVVKEVLEKKEQYGKTNYGRGEKVMVEFVSANPTGPMHIGNARGGAIGDGLSGALEWAGYDVTREFYINDAGNQIDKFGMSLEVRYLQHFLGEDQVEFPEDGYHGADITDRAEEYIGINGDRLLSLPSPQRQKALIDFALPKNIQRMRDDLHKYRIDFDSWFSESTLHDSGAVKAVVQNLKDKGKTYEKDGAVWYRATDFGADKDEVLVRANGNPTYFTADIAYHANKFINRGFSRCINVWGADHHGHVARLKGAMDAIGVGSEKLDVVLMQLVRLTKGGEPVRMSKRTGNAITLTDLLEEVPIDAARFFFNMREPGSTLDFDLDLAVEQSAQNPVYYVQYAHARICSIIKNLKAQGDTARPCDISDFMLLVDPAEKELIRTLASFPQEIISAAKQYDPARLTRFAMDLATKFHKFYNDCRVNVEDEALMQARLSLCLGTRQVLRNLLTMLKIDSPEVM